MKSKKFIIIIVILAILVVLGGTFAGLWFFTDVFNFLKPANEVFSSQIEKALNLEGAKFSNYSNFLNEYKEMSNKSTKMNLNLSANLKISELDSDIQNTINKSTIKIESSNDINGKKAQSKIGLYSNNSEVLTLDLVSNNGKIGIGCKDLYDKYLTVSSEDLEKWLKENSSDLDIDADELETMLESFSSSSIDPYELLYISEDDLKHFDEKYRNCLDTLISKDCYTTEKNVEVEVDGDDVKTTAYYLTLTGKDAYEFASKLTDLVKDDEVLTKLITEKINLILEASSQEKISEDNVKEFINEFISNLMENMEDIKDEKDAAIQIAVYSKNNKPVRIELNALKDAKKPNKSENVLSIEYAQSKDIYTIYNSGKAMATIKNEYSKNSEEEKVGKITVDVSGLSLGTLDYEIINKENEEKIALSLDMSLSKMSSSSEDISAKIEVSTKGDYKKEPVDINGVFAFSYGKESAEIKFEGSMEYGDVSVPELKSSNSVDVLKLSEKELQDELLVILEKASKVLPQRLKLIGVNVTAEDIYPSNLKANENKVETPDDNTSNNKVENTNSTTEAPNENVNNAA